MSPLTLLKNMLHPNSIVQGLTENPQVTVVTLKEVDPEASTGDIKIHLPPDSIVFRLDSSPKAGLFDPSAKMLHKGCDYVVFCLYKKKYWFVLIELKSKATKGAVKQLCCSAALIRYLRELIFLQNYAEERYELTSIIFSHAPRFVYKMTTNTGRVSYSPTRDHIHNLSYYGIKPPQNNRSFSLTKLLDCEPQTKVPGCDLFNRPRCHVPQETT